LLSIGSRLRQALCVALGSALLLTPLSARGASLQEDQDWPKAGFPSDITMYSYVPDQVVDSPPLLVLIHYCGGTASAVFGQAQGGKVVEAADQYGFVIVAPSSGRCWDVVSDQARTRDGNGDGHAITSMVAHAIDKYGVNPDRVYATGDSSGGMMTELLLGLYPDVFKGGVAMAGMPAGCRGDSESGSGGGYSGACAGGMVSRTAEAWGTIARSLAPDYSGLRPRIQMFHGDNDPTIDYQNHTEAIKEWTNVLGLGAAPTSEQDGLELGQHQATRQTWVADCGVPVVDAFTSHGGDHGPSDALFLSQYLIPFLGLDQLGPVDPYVAACDGAGTGGSGGQGAGGSDSGGSGGASVGGSSNAGGGSPVGGGGAVAAGGATSAGGTTTSGGAAATAGGTSGDGGMSTGASGGHSLDGAASGCSFPSQRKPASAGLPWRLLLPMLFLPLLRRKRRRSGEQDHSAASSL